MAVYVDEVVDWGKKGRWCHMIADTPDELHTMAARIGLRRAWYQPRSRPHYDLTPGKRYQAIRAGAIEKPAQWIIKNVEVWND